MKRFRKIFILVTVLLLVLIVAANLLLAATQSREKGRGYRVEISRLAMEMETNGKDSPDLSKCSYVTKVEKYNGDAAFYAAESDYQIVQIGQDLYRFDYTAYPEENSGFLALNLALGAMALVLLGVLLYVRQKILKPFDRLTELPYELSKGNLNAPIQESKSRFFGRFVWGVDLLRENLEQQKQRELNLQKEKKTLLLSLSHDIKTPLSAIKLYAKALSKGLYPGKEPQIAESINAKADEIEGFVAQIIQASNEDFLSLQVQLGEGYLAELMERIVTYYSEKFALVKTEFTVAPYTNCLLKTDLDRAEEVLQNILENTIKYGDGKQVSIDFAEEDGCMLVKIINTGCTLSDTELPHIFESFWRGSNAEKQPGSGLGLYICRQLMRNMGGEIFAELHGNEMHMTAVFPKA